MTEPLHGKLHTADEKLDRVLAVLEGRHDENGQWHPGMASRLKHLEDIVRWLWGGLTAVSTSVIAACVAAYIALGGKH